MCAELQRLVELGLSGLYGRGQVDCEQEETQQRKLAWL
ncbi:hypothetical protein SF06_13280 [Pseudomonas flexibilis]|nr:hypothetical protein SF06_13280 [Pseudomonas flexibilis]